MAADPAGQADDVHRGQRIRRRAVAELTVIVIAPALDAAAGGQRAGVGPPGGNRRTPLVSPMTSTAVSCIRRRAVAQLALTVVTPAL